MISELITMIPQGLKMIQRIMVMNLRFLKTPLGIPEEIS